MFKVLLFLGLTATSAQASGSGCDCSCFGVREQILRQDVHDDRKFTIERDGANIKLIPIPGPYNNVREPVILSGYKERSPIHPRLLERLLNEKIRFSLIRYNMHLTVENDWCNVEVAEADTGRNEMRIEFETGEKVSLWHPSNEDLFHPQDGSIQTHNLIPFPLQYLVRP